MPSPENTDGRTVEKERKNKAKEEVNLYLFLFHHIDFLCTFAADLGKKLCKTLETLPLSPT